MASKSTPRSARRARNLANLSTEKAGLLVVSSHPRFQLPTNEQKREILRSLGIRGDFGAKSFDLVMMPRSRMTIPSDVGRVADKLVLVEVKTTRAAIKDTALRGFFFGVTQRQDRLAEALGNQHRFCFVVVNDKNDYGQPFFVLMTAAELEERTKTKRTQYQVNLKSDLAADLKPNFGGVSMKER